MVFQVRNIWINRVWCLLLVAAVLILGVSPATPQNSKTEPQRRYEEAMRFIVRGQDKEAIAAVETLVKDFPTDYKSRLLLAELYYALGRESDARASIDQTIRLHPKESGPYEWLGFIAEEKGEWAQAEVHRRKAVELNSKEPKLYFDLGTVLAIQNKYGAASAAFGQAAARSPDWQHVRSNADVYAELDGLQKAGRATSSMRLPVMRLTIPRVYGPEEFVILANSHGGTKIVDEIRRIKPVKPSLVFRLEYSPKGDQPKWTCSSEREGETNLPAGNAFVAGAWDRKVTKGFWGRPEFCHDVPDGIVILILWNPENLTMKPAEVTPLVAAISDALAAKYGTRR